MLHLLQSAFAEALGWSLVDSLWQTGALWGLYSLVTLNGKKFSSVTRHNLALLSLFAGTLWFIASFLINFNNALGRERIHSLSQYLSENIAAGFSQSLLTNALPYLSVAYIVCVLLYGATVGIRFTQGKKSLRHSMELPPPQLQMLVGSLREKIRLTRKVVLWISGKTISPLTTGLFRPMILLPVAALNKLSMAQLEAVLAHELFHIKRKDYLLNLLVMVCEVVLFFNPFMRLLAGTVKRERENSCDDFVLSMGFDAWQYSQALYYLGGGSLSEHRIAMAATGNNKKILLERIKRLLKLSSERRPVLKPLVLFFLCLSAAFLGTRSKKQVDVLHEPVVSAREASTVLPAAEPSTNMVIVEEKVVMKSTGKETNATAVVKKKKGTVRKTEDPGTGIDGKTVDDTQEYTAGEELLYNVPEFIYNEANLDFTIIIPAKPETPAVILREKPAPYVPGATFYVPFDTLPVKVKRVVRI